MISLRRTVPALLAAALLTAGCTTEVAGSAQPSSSSAAPAPTVQPEDIQFRFVVTDGSGGDTVADREGKSYVLGPVVLDGTKVRSAKADYQEQYGQWVVNIELSSDGAAVFGQATSEHVNEQLAIVVAGTVVSAPVIQSAITGGKVQITGNFTRTDVEQLADQINGR